MFDKESLLTSLLLHCFILCPCLAGYFVHVQDVCCSELLICANAHFKRVAVQVVSTWRALSRVPVVAISVMFVCSIHYMVNWLRFG